MVVHVLFYCYHRTVFEFIDVHCGNIDLNWEDVWMKGWKMIAQFNVVHCCSSFMFYNWRLVIEYCTFKWNLTKFYHFLWFNSRCCKLFYSVIFLHWWFLFEVILYIFQNYTYWHCIFFVIDVNVYIWVTL